MASTDYRVITPERVSLQYGIAGIGSRGAAALVDMLVQTLLAVVLYLVFGGTLLVSTVAFRDSTIAVVIGLVLVAVGIFALNIGYFLVFEIIWNGQTPGKRVVGVRVIRENGYPIRPVDSVIRNLVRIVDSLPFGYTVGVFTMLLNARAKRLGDFAAGTIVVHEGPRAASIPGISGSTDGETQSASLDREHATLVRDFLMRRSELDPHARESLARRLSTVLARRYGLAPDPNPEAFLERLV